MYTLSGHPLPFLLYITSYFSLNDNRRLFVFSDIVLTFGLAYQKHLRLRWHCHRTKVQIQWAVDIATANESTDIVGTARSVVTLLLYFLARLQRLSLTFQTSRLRILPTDTLNQVTLNQDLSVYTKFVENHASEVISPWKTILCWIDCVNSISRIFSIRFHSTPITDKWKLVPWEYFQWFAIKLPLIITNGSTYHSNFSTGFPFACYWLSLVPIHHHSTFNVKLSQGQVILKLFRKQPWL